MADPEDDLAECTVNGERRAARFGERRLEERPAAFFAQEVGLTYLALEEDIAPINRRKRHFMRLVEKERDAAVVVSRRRCKPHFRRKRVYCLSEIHFGPPLGTKGSAAIPPTMARARESAVFAWCFIA